MDVVALVSVISSGVVGLAGVGAALWSASRPTAVAREQRKATAYQEVMRYVHARSRWLETAQNNLEIRDDEAGLHYEWRRVPKPADSEETTTRSLLDAFASADVRSKYYDWDTAANKADHVIVMKLDYDDIDAEAESRDSWEWRADLGANLMPTERAHREALADAVSADLGHRRPKRHLLVQRRSEVENPSADEQPLR